MTIKTLLCFSSRTERGREREKIEGSEEGSFKWLKGKSWKVS